MVLILLSTTFKEAGIELTTLSDYNHFEVAEKVILQSRDRILLPAGEKIPATGTTVFKL
jgi:hypothetical protein